MSDQVGTRDSYNTPAEALHLANIRGDGARIGVILDQVRLQNGVLTLSSSADAGRFIEVSLRGDTLVVKLRNLELETKA